MFLTLYIGEHSIFFAELSFQSVYLLHLRYCDVLNYLQHGIKITSKDGKRMPACFYLCILYSPNYKWKGVAAQSL